jgi:hypothetical protein
MIAKIMNKTPAKTILLCDLMKEQNPLLSMIDVN